MSEGRSHEKAVVNAWVSIGGLRRFFALLIPLHCDLRGPAAVVTLVARPMPLAITTLYLYSRLFAGLRLGQPGTWQKEDHGLGK